MEIAIGVDGRRIGSKDLEANVNDLGIASAADITYPPFVGTPPRHRPIQISPSIRRTVKVLLIWAAASLLLGGIGSVLHHNVVVTQTDSGLCKR